MNLKYSHIENKMEVWGVRIGTKRLYGDLNYTKK